MLDTVVISCDDVVCSVVLALWLGCLCLVLCGPSCTSAISSRLWSSVYICQRVECAYTSPVRTECGMFAMYCMPVSAVL